MSTQLKFGNFDEEADAEAYRVLFTDVILPISTGQLYTYRVPSAFLDTIKQGQRVAVQFGKKKVYTAIVARIHENPPKDYTAKFLLDLLDQDPVIGAKQLELWYWMAEYYCCTLGDIMDAALPAFLKMKSETSILLHPDYKNSSYELSDKELRIIENLHLTKPVSIADLAEILEQKTVMPLVKSLYEKGLVIMHEELNEGYKKQKEIIVSHNFELNNKEQVKELFEKLEPAPRQSDLLMAYLQSQKSGKPILRKNLLKASNAPASALQALVDKGILTLFETETDRLPAFDNEMQEYAAGRETGIVPGSRNSPHYAAHQALKGKIWQ
jgi:primosomal protein N' (replication factor Y) (superfamily II helicase)